MRNISQAALRQVLVPKVDDDVQIESLEAYAGVAEAIDRLRTEIAASGARLGHLRRFLLAAAFAGHLTGATSDLSQ